MDWTGYEKYSKFGWQQILHIVTVPFYYVEYGIAQLGAIQVWNNSRKDYKKAVEKYKEGLRAGTTNTLPQLFEKAGIKFVFGREMLNELMCEISKERWK